MDGGANGDGEVFSVPITGGDPTVLASFDGTNGQGPFGGLTLIGTTLYGTTSGGGGPNQYGTMFSLPTTGGTPTVLGSFSGGNGVYSDATLTLNGSTLFGTTLFNFSSTGINGIGDGIVFSLPLTGGAPTGLVAFDGTNGAYPYGGLTLIGNTLYGTAGGGVNGDGIVYSLTPVPEASSVISLGLLLTLGLSGMVIAKKRTRTQGKGQC